MFMILILLKSIFNMYKNNIGVNQKKPTWEINILKEININKTNTHFTSNNWKQQNHNMTFGNPGLGLGQAEQDGR